MLQPGVHAPQGGGAQPLCLARHGGGPPDRRPRARKEGAELHKGIFEAALRDGGVSRLPRGEGGSQGRRHSARRQARKREGASSRGGLRLFVFVVHPVAGCRELPQHAYDRIRRGSEGDDRVRARRQALRGAGRPRVRARPLQERAEGPQPHARCAGSSSSTKRRLASSSPR